MDPFRLRTAGIEEEFTVEVVADWTLIVGIGAPGSEHCKSSRSEQAGCR
jgi:hypothetical protein